MKELLAEAAKAYEAGEPIMTDAEFDRLVDLYGYDNVGGEVSGRAIPHYKRMFSLQKCFVGEKLIELPGEVIETPKLDGAAVSLLYIGGRFVRGLTRGDGKAGLDITEKLATLVPTQIQLTGEVQITGEVVAPKTIPNARNYAAGALNLKDIEEFKKREITFVAYGVSPNQNSTWTTDMSMLHSFGFKDVFGLGILLEGIYPTDGRVFRVNDNEKFNSLGWTNKHPRGAYALKEKQEGVVTVLNEVVWQVGRSGIVAPVAILEPVKVGDATVSRATLHNLKYIRELGLELGCSVEIIRSGEIIPRVVRRV